jgi:hypothetical protein
MPLTDAWALTDLSLECRTDDDCGEAHVCAADGQTCVPAEQLCVSSEVCADGEICHIGRGCPYEGDRCLAGPVGLCDPPLRVEMCAGDADCDARELCALVRTATRLQCAEGDMRCQQHRVARCTWFVTVCAEDADCAATDACIRRRCAPRDQRAQAEAIVVDDAKVDRLAAILEEPVDPQPDDGCQVSAARRRGPSWMWVGLLSVLCVRRRRSVLSRTLR